MSNLKHDVCLCFNFLFSGFYKLNHYLMQTNKGWRHLLPTNAIGNIISHFILGLIYVYVYIIK